jgi:hypothetical protein
MVAAELEMALLRNAEHCFCKQPRKYRIDEIGHKQLFPTAT